VGPNYMHVRSFCLDLVDAEESHDHSRRLCRWVLQHDHHAETEGL
jgi:hypothetical protein